MSVYRLLLRLLPRDRRLRHGRQMQAVFADQRDEARRRARPLGVAWLWMKETFGLLRFSAREWAGRLGRWLEVRLPSPWSRGPANFFAELRWAWRGVRSRGVRALLIITLLGTALGANTIVFAAADSFVFNRVPYRDATRLIEIGEQQRGWYSAVWPELVPVWRQQTDLFSAFHAHQWGKQVYLTGGQEPRFVWSEEVTPGLFEMLGAVPRWGRPFVNDDARAGQPSIVILAEEIARQEFGDPARAIGQRLRADGESPVVVGVMPLAFRFPTGSERIWRPLDVTSVRERSLIHPIGRVAAGLSIDTLSKGVQARAPMVLQSLKPTNAVVGKSKFPTEARPIAPSIVDPRVKRLFLLLSAAAACLLVIACANVANLELASAITRTRVYAIEIALGASSGTLMRVALLEGALIIGGALVVGAGLAYGVTSFLATHLPTAMMTAIANPIDLDARAVGVMAAVALLTWLVTSLPLAILARRADVLDALKLDGRTLSSSRTGARVRSWLTIGEVAMTVLLLVGALLNVRSYAALLQLPKGFDSITVVSIAVRQRPHPTEKDADLQARLLAAIRTRTDVLSATIADASPPDSAGSISAHLRIDDQPRRADFTTMGLFNGDPEFFRTLHLPLRSGRLLEPGEPAGNVVVDENFAQRYWPGGQALGETFDLNGAGVGSTSQFRIVGIVAHVRNSHDSAVAPSDSFFAMYQGLSNASAKYAPLSFLVRLNDVKHLGDLTSMVRTLAPGSRVRSATVDDLYAAMFGDELLAMSIMSAFGALAFLVAMVGIYGVMAYLVASRTREIGIRLALGADRQAINRLVLKSSMRLVVAGAAMGLVTALAASRFVQSLLFGVSSTDPRIYGVVVLTVIVTAGLATWQPARRAGRIDPSRLLRE
jgi:predicted permease